MSLLVELDVEEQTARHSQDEGGVEKNEPGLTNVGIVEENQASRHNTSREAIAGLPHYQVGDGYRQGAQNGGHSTEGDIGNLVRNVGVADVLEVEVAIVANKPAHEGK